MKIVATMAGSVLRVYVNVGDQLEESAEVVVLESMKMEIPIESHVGGTVKEVKVSVGDFVNEGDVLLIVLE